MAEFNKCKKSKYSLPRPPPGEDVVISGVAGVFPNSDNVQEFQENIFNKVDLTTETERRWKNVPELPPRHGMLNETNLYKFDASSLGISQKEAHLIDPICRLVIEKSYEAMIDAGLNPTEQRGSKTGVFIGLSLSESEKTWMYERPKENVVGLLSAKLAFASYVSYYFGLNGPSFSVDTACSSSLYALENAYSAIRLGRCDAALVAGVNLCLHPYISLQFHSLGVLSPDGRCKSFDDSANGYCRAEACVVVYLQKSKDAKRIHSNIVHIKTNCDGFKEEGITFPSSAIQKRLLREFYDECGFDPSSVDWIEAHGTGTKVGDPEEINAIESIFCEKRQTPLLIGSVKTNIGHTEPAAPLCSIVKVLIAMESGFIPPNINYSSPRQDIKALHNGKIAVISEKTQCDSAAVGVNAFGFGGANGHILLKRNEKSKKEKKKKNLEDLLPSFVVASGRTEQAVNALLMSAEKNGFDEEYISLLYEIHKKNISGHHYRGYMIHNFSSGDTIKNIKRMKKRDQEVWFLFRDSQCKKLPIFTRSMMELPGFSSCIQRCHEALLPHNVKLFDIIDNYRNEASDELNMSSNSSVAFNLYVVALQIGLIEVLANLGIFPDKLLGNSMGEFIAAYCDGALSLEETIVSTYFFSLVWLNNNEEGTQGDNILDKQVHPDSKVNEKLLNQLKKIITTAKPFSNKFFCLSHEGKINKPAEKHCSSGYFEKLSINSKSIDDITKFMSKNSVVIDFSIFDEEFYSNTINESLVYIPIVSDGISKNNDFVSGLFNSIGRLYIEGVNPQCRRLLPDVTFPVSRGTPMISPNIKWEHSKDWFIRFYKLKDVIQSGEKVFSVSLKNDDLEYLYGHKIDGRILFPATGYLELVWQLIGQIYGEVFSEFSVVFRNVLYHRATNISKEGTVDFNVSIQQGSGNFEITEGGSVIVSGNVSVPDNIQSEMTDKLSLTSASADSEYPNLTQKDIYKEFRIRGYNYSGLFKSLVSADNKGGSGKIGWHDNWVAFMDNMLQMEILSIDSRDLIVPVFIQKIVIDTKLHFQTISNINENPIELPVGVYKNIRLIKSGGIEIKGLKARIIPRRKIPADPVLERYDFIPYSITDEEISANDVIGICTQIMIENTLSIKLKVLEVFDKFYTLLAPIMVETISNLPMIQGQIIVLSDEELEPDTGYTIEKRSLCDNDSASLVIIPVTEKTTEQVFMDAMKSVSEGGFVIWRESIHTSNGHNSSCSELKPAKLSLIFEAYCQNEKISMFKKVPGEFTEPIIVKVNDNNLSWLPGLQETLQNRKQKNLSVLLVSQGNAESGIVGFTNCLRKEPGGDIVRCLFIKDKNVSDFNLNDPFYWNQVKKELAINVLSNGVWGSYKHLPLNAPKQIASEFGVVEMLNYGDLSSFNWFHHTFGSYSKKDEELVYIYYSAVNFRDIMMSTGRLPKRIVEDVYKSMADWGFEFSGRLANGRRVMGIFDSGGFATAGIADKSLLWDVPENWSLEDAATVPIVYCTVISALFLNGRISQGKSILIHAGSGGVGLAAINMALHVGCTVFTTVGTNEKREFIKRHFPQLMDCHIGHSRDSSFEQLIMHETKGRGVDLILNSLAEDKLQASVRCLAKGGKFLEIGKYDLENNNPLGMRHFKNISSFHGVMLDTLFAASREEKLEMHKLLSDALKAGIVKPLRRVVFNCDQYEQAFRYMASGKHVGKVLIKNRDEEPQKICKPSYSEKLVTPKFHCRKDATYVVIGGLGGFGLELIDWLAHRGAKKVFISSRNGITTGYQAMRVRIWRKHGIKVEISTLPLTSRSEVKKLLLKARDLGPVSAIFNLAAVLKDSLFQNMKVKDFETVLKPKAHMTYLLDQISREVIPELEQFVVFSSVSCGKGNAGQTNYGMANSIMERICENRRKSNLHGLAVQWGAVGDVGLVAEKQEENIELVVGGTLQQRIRSCLQVFDSFLFCPHAIVSSMVVAEKQIGANKHGNVIDNIFHILGIRDKRIVSPQSTLAELGMDSMMAVEIKQMLEQKFETFLTSQDIRTLSIGKLHELSQNNSEKEIISSDESKNDASPVNFKFMLIRVIGDEKLSEETVVKLPSQQGANMVVKKNSTLILIPGIEGSSTVMEPLAKNLFWHVYCLQYSNSHGQNNSISSIAQQLIPEIKKLIKLDEKFVIAGYSFGTIVAIEVTHILEKEGYLGNLILLDGSPDYVKTLLVEVFLNGDVSEDFIQRSVLLRAASLLWSSESMKFQDKLSKANNWMERLNLFIDNSSTINYSKNYMRDVVNSIYCRTRAALAYEGPPEKSIKSSVSLIRPTESPSVYCSEDYGLSKFCIEEISVHILGGNHITLLENEKFGNILSSITGIQHNTNISDF